MSIVGSLILLFTVTLSVILLASFGEIRHKNVEMLERYVAEYSLDEVMIGLTFVIRAGSELMINLVQLCFHGVYLLKSLHGLFPNGSSLYKIQILFKEANGNVSLGNHISFIETDFARKHL